MFQNQGLIPGDLGSTGGQEGPSTHKVIHQESRQTGKQERRPGKRGGIEQALRTRLAPALARGRSEGGGGKRGEEGKREDTCCTKHVFITLSLGALASKLQWHFRALMMSLGAVT